MKYILRNTLVLGIYLIISLLVSVLFSEYTETDILIGTILCALSNIIVTFLLDYKKKPAQDKIERINKNIHNGIWRKTIINI